MALIDIKYPCPAYEWSAKTHRRFKNEVKHLEVFVLKAHRDRLMFTTTSRHPHELYPA
jgi:hypothetical protein